MGNKVLPKAEQSFIQLLLLKSDKVIAKIESNLSKNIKVQFGKNIMLWKIKMKDKKILEREREKAGK